MINDYPCPNCGEDEKLEWIMDHVIKCKSCGTEYDPATMVIHRRENDGREL